MSTYFSYDSTLSGTVLNNLKSVNCNSFYLPQFKTGSENRVAYVGPAGTLQAEGTRIIPNVSIQNISATPVVVNTVSSQAAAIDIVLQVLDPSVNIITATMRMSLYTNGGAFALFSSQALATPNATITLANSTTITMALPSSIVLTWTVNGAGNLLVAGTAVNNANTTVNIRANITRI